MTENPTEYPVCPECGSYRTWKDGLRKTGYGEAQRYLCRLCGFRFSESTSQLQVKVNITRKRLKVLHPPMNLADRRVSSTDFPLKEAPDDFPFSSRENVTSHGSSQITIAEKPLNTLPLYTSNRRVCATEGEAKNLATVEPLKGGLAGATEKNQLAVKGEILEFKWKLKREGYAEATITTYGSILEILSKKGADLYNPENVKDAIALQDTWGTARKGNAVKAYTLFLQIKGLIWKPPKYNPVYKLPFIPVEREIDDIIAGCSRKMAAFIELLKETAMRRGEAFALKWTDIDSVQRTVRIMPEKGSNPRIFRISNNLAAMLCSLPRTSERVFSYKNILYLEKTFRKQRKRIAFKLGNPRILQIHFHTLRHWKATMEYAKTKDILHVKQLLGHKSIENTLKYTQLINFGEDEYLCKTAKTVDEAVQLIEIGYEYVTDIEGCKLFKKRK